MNLSEFITRLCVGVALFVFGVLVWALGPYLAGVHASGGEEFYAPILSIFFGTNKPATPAVVGFLLSRGCFTMAIVSWIVIPAARYFVNADFTPLARAGFIVFMAASVAFFLGSLLLHFVLYT